MVTALPHRPRCVSLEICGSCAGSVLGLIGQRLPQLSRLELAGNAAQLKCDAHGAAAVVPLLERLQLTYSSPYFEFTAVGSSVPDRRIASYTLPGCAAPTLAHAT